MNRYAAQILSCLAFVGSAFIARCASAQDGYHIAFFNGIWTPPEDGNSTLRVLALKLHTYVHNGELVDYRLYYNTSVLPIEDLRETFQQRALESDPVFSRHPELFWDYLTSDASHVSANSLLGAILVANPVANDFLRAVSMELAEATAAALFDADKLQQPALDYQGHRTRLTTQLLRHKKIVLLAHSQGNLFMNALYGYGVAVGVAQ